MLDSNNLLAPPGVEILPFDPNSWFYQNFAFAMRVLPTMPSLNLSSVSDPADPAAGTAVTLTAQFGLRHASLTPPPSGNATFEAIPTTPGPNVVYGTPIILGSSPVSSNLTAQIQTSALPAGSYLISVLYAGDENFASDAGFSTPLSLTEGASPNTQFVDNVYVDLLHRAADAGSAGWIHMLNAGAPASTVAQGIENSAEYRAGAVASMYALYLNRLPDSGGLTFWSQALANGGNLEQVEAGIVGSPEYFKLKGGSDADYVQALYFDVLGRTPDPAGESAWLQALAKGASTWTAAFGFFTSAEFRRNLAASYYNDYLGRPADPAGLTAWLNELLSGQSDLTVLGGILGSAEGFGKWS